MKRVKITDTLSKKQLLFCPGPVNVAANVKRTIIEYEIGHREKEFSELLERIQSNLFALYRIKHPEKYHAVVITGSGTAANETVISSVVGNKYILILANGEFGERLFAISSLHNRHTKILKWPWAEKMGLNKIENYLKRHRVDIVAMVHHETSTGMLNPIAEVGALTRKYQKLFIVDTVSSAAAHDIRMENWNIGFATSSASKAIASLPGAAYVVGKKEEFEKLQNIPPRTMYLNLYKFYEYSTKYHQTPNTPAVSTFFALDQALQNVLKVGLTTYQKHLRERAQYLREGMKKMRLEFLIAEGDMSSVLTTIKVPFGIDLEKLRLRLHERNIIIYNGKGPLLGKVFQVANIGDLDAETIDYFLKELGHILISLKPKSIKRIDRYETVKSAYA